MSTYQVRSLEEADQIIKEHEKKTKTNYTLLKSTKNFGSYDIPSELNGQPDSHINNSSLASYVFLYYLKYNDFNDILFLLTACNNEEFEVRFDTVGVPYCGVPFYVAGLKILQCQATPTEKSSPKKKDIKEEVNYLNAYITTLSDYQDSYLKSQLLVTIIVLKWTSIII